MFIPIGTHSIKSYRTGHNSVCQRQRTEQDNLGPGLWAFRALRKEEANESNVQVCAKERVGAVRPVLGNDIHLNLRVSGSFQRKGCLGGDTKADEQSAKTGKGEQQ